MKILVTGDIHNEFGQLNMLLNKKHPDLVLCCGDFGYWPKASWGIPFEDIKTQGAKILWCDGNHEDHWTLNERTTDELVPNVHYMPRGSTYTLDDGRTIMFMGGADSIDKKHRIKGVTWFPEELVTQTDLHNLPDIKVDIFITHTCPEILLDDMLKVDPRKVKDPSNYVLSELWKMYKPSLWYFGHWHRYRHGKFLGTEWHCLAASEAIDRWWMWLPDKGGDIDRIKQ